MEMKMELAQLLLLLELLQLVPQLLLLQQQKLTQMLLLLELLQLLLQLLLLQQQKHLC